MGNLPIHISGYKNERDVIVYTVVKCSCGSVIEHCVSSTKVVGSIPREHTY